MRKIIYAGISGVINIGIIALQGATAECVSDVQFSLQHFANGLHVARLLGNIFPNDIYFVEQNRCCALQGIGFAHVSVCVGVDDDFDAFFLQFYVDIFSGHHGIAVVVYHARFTPVDVELFAFECFDFRVLVERFVKHLDADLGCVEHVERFHDNNIHQPVAHRCLRCNVSIVAVL